MQKVPTGTEVCALGQPAAAQTGVLQQREWKQSSLTVFIESDYEAERNEQHFILRSRKLHDYNDAATAELTVDGVSVSPRARDKNKFSAPDNGHASLAPRSEK